MTRKYFPQTATAFVAFCMLMSFIIGWNMNKNFTAFDNQRNAIEQTSNINLEIVGKYVKNEFAFGLPTGYYLNLSNDTTIQVTKEEFDKYERGQSYDFELIESFLVSQRIRTYKQ